MRLCGLTFPHRGERLTCQARIIFSSQFNNRVYRMLSWGGHDVNSTQAQFVNTVDVTGTEMLLKNKATDETYYTQCRYTLSTPHTPVTLKLLC